MIHMNNVQVYIMSGFGNSCLQPMTKVSFLIGPILDDRLKEKLLKP